jgi:aryl-alcohol dehydrogenase-like predicted oxidoreductase
MKYSFLGKSGLSVSRLAFGTATFASTASASTQIGTGEALRIGQIDGAVARRMIGLCLDSGVNFFDTSNVYSAGESETILGQALGSGRQRVLLGTKVSLRVGPGEFDVGASRRHIISACEDSLRRLKTDWIDLYQLHYPDPLTPIEETLRALDDLVKTGKVRYIGCSNFSGWQVAAATGISAAKNLQKFVSHQIFYSLLGRDAEHELVPVSIDQDVGLMVWGPLANGFLSGKYTRGNPVPEQSRLEAMPNYPAFHDWEAAMEKGYDLLETVQSIAAARGRPVSDVAINWILRKPWINSVVLGARNEAQLKANLKATEWALTEAEVATLDAASAPHVPYPYWTQQAVMERRLPLPSYRP